MDKIEVIKKRINEIGLKVSDNEKVINELVDNNLELKIIRKGLEEVIRYEDKKGVKEGGEKGRGRRCNL